jgi:hypothetical protein
VDANGVAVAPRANYGLVSDGNGLYIDLASDPALQFSAGKLDAKLDSMRGLDKDSSGAYLKLASNKGVSFDGSGNLQLVDGDGIVVDSNGIAVDLASNSGMEFSGGKLQIKAYANQTAHTANGLEVLGVPALFKIAGSAVSADVSATNLNTLTAGPSSDAKALHMHSAEVSYLTAAASETTGNVVALDSSGKAALTTTAGAGWAIGVVESADAGTCRVVRGGKAASVLAGATPGMPYYMKSDGTLTSTMPASGRIVLMGFAASATDLMVQVRDFGYRA